MSLLIQLTNYQFYIVLVTKSLSPSMSCLCRKEESMKQCGIFVTGSAILQLQFHEKKLKMQEHPSLIMNFTQTERCQLGWLAQWLCRYQLQPTARFSGSVVRCIASLPLSFSLPTNKLLIYCLKVQNGQIAGPG